MSWISVKDKLPELNKCVLGWCELVDCHGETLGEDVEKIVRSFDGYYLYINDDEMPLKIINVSHWQPLPEPPKED